MTEFFDELPGDPYEKRTARLRNNYPRETSADLHAHARELMANPMKWSLYPRPLKKTTANAGRMASAIREKTVAAYDPSLGFQAASREGRCYIRYNPDAVDPHKEAYALGYADGRREAMAEVAVAVWDMRQTVAKIEGWSDNNHVDHARKRLER